MLDKIWFYLYSIRMWNKESHYIVMALLGLPGTHNTVTTSLFTTAKSAFSSHFTHTISWCLVMLIAGSSYSNCWESPTSSVLDFLILTSLFPRRGDYQLLLSLTLNTYPWLSLIFLVACTPQCVFHFSVYKIDRHFKSSISTAEDWNPISTKAALFI